MNLFYSGHASVLQPEMIVEWKRQRNMYNFEKLPSIALICVDYEIIKPFYTWKSQKLKGLKGKHFIHKDLLFCADFDNGAPGIINLLEELRALGVKHFIFIGYAGIIGRETREAELYKVDQAISAVGVSRFYTSEESIGPIEDKQLSVLTKEWPFPSINCCSVDTAFRETRPFINEAIAKGASLIEMECAAVYAFAQYYKCAALCLLIAADDLREQWKAPQDLQGLKNKLKHHLQNIIVPSLIQK